MENINLINNDCLEFLRNYNGEKFNCVILDLPYGITACEWDIKIDLCELWRLLIKNSVNNCNYIFFCTAKFGYEIIKSNEKFFRYDLIWEKEGSVGYLNCNNQPLRKHENIYIFSNPYPPFDLNTNKELREYAKNVYEYIGKSKPRIFEEMGDRRSDHFLRFDSLQFSLPTKKTYEKLIKLYNIDKMENFIQYEELKNKYIKLHNKKKYNTQKIIVKEFKKKIPLSINDNIYGKKTKGKLKYKEEIRDFNFPHSILKYGKDEKNTHPTQKPKNLLKYLINSYSNKGDLIYDPTMGTGSTARACIETERRFIGTELNKEFYEIAKNNIMSINISC